MAEEGGVIDDDILDDPDKDPCHNRKDGITDETHAHKIMLLLEE